VNAQKIVSKIAAAILRNLMRKKRRRNTSRTEKNWILNSYSRIKKVIPRMKKENRLLLSLWVITRIIILRLEKELSKLYKTKQNREKRLSKVKEEGIHWFFKSLLVKTLLISRLFWLGSNLRCLNKSISLLNSRILRQNLRVSKAKFLKRQN
jgi:hypothetical protein